MKKIVLASQSPRRKELLELIGVPFICQPSGREEIITKKKPGEIVMELAYQKAIDVAAEVEDGTVIIAADTIVVYKKEILGKPKDSEDAYRMLSLLEGSRHDVYTGVVILVKENGKNKVTQFAERTSVYMWNMTDSQIEEYVLTKEPMDKAGAYGIQGKAALFIKKIKGDYSNVVGLPVSRVYRELVNKKII